MAYGSTLGVAYMCRNQLSGLVDFTTSTSPSYDAVESWLSTGCALIETDLASQGYSMPVSSTAQCYDLIVHLNNLYAAARVEMARLNVSVGTGERTRGMLYMKEFQDNLRMLHDIDLTYAGLDLSGDGASIYVGGISETERSSIESDSDRTTPRFKRGQFLFDDAIHPDEDD